MRRILRGTWLIRSDPLKNRLQPSDPACMEILSPINVLIGLTILGTMVAVLHAVATDIQQNFLRLDLARRVIARREQYYRELRGEQEIGEVVLLEEDNPGLDVSEVAMEIPQDSIDPDSVEVVEAAAAA